MKTWPRLLVLLATLGATGVRAFQQNPLELVVLGSGGPGATGRASSSYCLLVDGTPRMLIDAGSGSFLTLGKAGLSLAGTDIVLITHLHVDHVAELPGLVKARAVSSGAPITFNIWGPGGSPGAGTKAYFPPTSVFVANMFGRHGEFAYLHDFAAPITWQPHDLELPGVSPRVIFHEHDLKVSAIAGHHGDAPAVIYRVDHAGHSITFSGDIDAQGLAHLARIAMQTDLLVFNSVVLDPPGSPEVLYTLHTPPRSIGKVASQAQVRQLLLSHLSPGVESHRELVEASIHASFAGPVVMAEDGLRVSPGR